MGVKDDDNKVVNSRKAINFDLSTKELEKHFSSRAEAYNQIKTFMLENGFEHRQKSGYISKNEMDEYAVVNLFIKLGEKLPWLEDCVNEFDIANIGNELSVKHLIHIGASRVTQDSPKNKKQEKSHTQSIKQAKAKKKTNKKSNDKDRGIGI